MSGQSIPSRNHDQPRTMRRLLLFVADREPYSLEAHQNLLKICDAELRGRFQLEVIDIFEDEKTALAHHVLVVPCLVVLEPSPMVMMAGTLNDTGGVRAALRLKG